MLMGWDASALTGIIYILIMPRFFLQFLAAIGLPLLIGLSLPENNTSMANTPKILSTDYDGYPDYLPGAFTGGFGEETCHSCHFDYDLNDERGSLTVQGPDEKYTPGESYEFTVIVESERIGNGGFQMTARFEDGSQAGRFDWTGDRLTFTPSVDENIQYLQHSEAGSNLTAEREISWSFEWIAPDNNPGPVIFNIAANAGNDDYSAFGDWIYVQEIIVKPQQ
jgi:hypothetical protein